VYKQTPLSDVKTKWLGGVGIKQICPLDEWVDGINDKQPSIIELLRISKLFIN
jgi:hypothetical protein